ncbi:unnamed protein product, partial [Trichogramma brassicae]
MLVKMRYLVNQANLTLLLLHFDYRSLYERLAVEVRRMRELNSIWSGAHRASSGRHIGEHVSRYKNETCCLRAVTARSPLLRHARRASNAWSSCLCFVYVASYTKLNSKCRVKISNRSRKPSK